MSLTACPPPPSLACCIQDGLFALASILQYLTVLDLAGNNLGKAESQSGTVALAAVLATNASITRLSLARNDLCKGSMRGGGRKKGLMELASALVTNETLVHLDLSNNYPTVDPFSTAGFGANCAFGFGSALAGNGKLQCLDLRNCGVTDHERAQMKRATGRGRVLFEKGDKPLAPLGEKGEFDGGGGGGRRKEKAAEGRAKRSTTAAAAEEGGAEPQPGADAEAARGVGVEAAVEAS
jgi:hypothetical protein